MRTTLTSTRPRPRTKTRTSAALVAAGAMCGACSGFFSMPAFADASCSYSTEWLAGACRRIERVAQQGTWDLYVTGYGWHINGYSEEERKSLNAQSWGGGAGKHFTDENGNEDILFAFVFLDSHENAEPIGGWARQWYTKPVAGGLSLGGGYFAGFTAREDVANYLPVPLVLPVGSIRYRKASVMGTFIPRIPGVTKGDVAFFWSRYEF
ncbi:Phospholipid:lipid A palmitoyltransferase [Paraburkholderia piptadeniae]|uniref:Phospholipid:lipid A palmitoyltransferase n=2 Tax=Paraburkholderia piptadeniae TaxID=1701573 RepID=A0A1N7RZN5_9BURK|nr:Phospholipid:lipid A palmitoyltransferase [Paraburkholderia piptadeniae]